ncbi:hypothetical protein B0H17DRAFT_1094096 [Mycena rosella]|uniref:Uncharacterized protein n=1 Tax=Mycena rosella TaxID=1033263 RepID=A0AAD7CSW8_MYCRO|nr:hypothetical protein B0H17DRAFT_1094096 [Mycena rosella]
MHRFVYLGFFVVINCRTIFIHDSDKDHPLKTFINGPAHGQRRAVCYLGRPRGQLGSGPPP